MIVKQFKMEEENDAQLAEQFRYQHLPFHTMQQVNDYEISHCNLVAMVSLVRRKNVSYIFFY